MYRLDELRTLARINTAYMKLAKSFRKDVPAFPKYWPVYELLTDLGHEIQSLMPPERVERVEKELGSGLDDIIDGTSKTGYEPRRSEA